MHDYCCKSKWMSLNRKICRIVEGTHPQHPNHQGTKLWIHPSAYPTAHGPGSSYGNVRHGPPATGKCCSWKLRQNLKHNKQNAFDPENNMTMKKQRFQSFEDVFCISYQNWWFSRKPWMLVFRRVHIQTEKMHAHFFLQYLSELENSFCVFFPHHDDPTWKNHPPSAEDFSNLLLPKDSGSRKATWNFPEFRPINIAWPFVLIPRPYTNGPFASCIMFILWH